MKPRCERRGKILQEQIDSLEKELATNRHDMESADAKLGETPRLRDRNKFFHSVLNSDLADYEQIAPTWRERRRCARRVKRIEAQLAAKEARIMAVTRRGVVDEPEYRALRAKVGREERAGRACTRMLSLVDEARRPIDRAGKIRPRDEKSRTALDQIVGDVSNRLRAVRKQAAEVTASLSPHGSLDVSALDVELPGSKAETRTRIRQYKDAAAHLDSIARKTRAFLPGIRTRKSSIETQLRQYVTEARARFATSPPPP